MSTLHEGITLTWKTTFKSEVPVCKRNTVLGVLNETSNDT